MVLGWEIVTRGVYLYIIIMIRIIFLNFQKKIFHIFSFLLKLLSLLTFMCMKRVLWIQIPYFGALKNFLALL